MLTPAIAGSQTPGFMLTPAIAGSQTPGFMLTPAIAGSQTPGFMLTPAIAGLYDIAAVKRAIAIFVFVLLSCAQQRAEQLPIRTYTTADGLPRDRVYKIVPDPRGFLWFCTYDGLSRFDGYEFVNYSVAQGLPHRVVFDLLITRSGDYWVATSHGLARFNPLASSSESKFETYLPTGRR